MGGLDDKRSGERSEAGRGFELVGCVYTGIVKGDAWAYGGWVMYIHTHWVGEGA